MKASITRVEGYLNLIILIINYFNKKENTIICYYQIMKSREISVTSRNQITIPWDIRALIDWFKPYSKVKVILKDKDTIILKPIRGKKIEIKSKKKKKKFGKYLLMENWDKKA